MRYVILTKKQATGICAAVLCFVTVLVCSISVFANSDRLLPIYSVGTEKKQIAISFDAAWGNDDTETLIDIFLPYRSGDQPRHSGDDCLLRAGGSDGGQSAHASVRGTAAASQ